MNENTPLAGSTFVSAHNQKVYEMAKSLLGTHLSGDNAFLGCATTVNTIVARALGTPIGGGASTLDMYHCLQTSPRFTLVSTPQAGDIVISPTGTSGFGPQQHGHVGIVLRFGIGSNSSEDGIFHENYTLETWLKVFHDAFRFPVYYYRFV